MLPLSILLSLSAGAGLVAGIPFDLPSTHLRSRQSPDDAFAQIIQDAQLPDYVEPSLNRVITDWLAIGDSFAAGISADVPNDQVNGYCSRFKQSYPSQINANPRFPGFSTSRTFVFGACTGAKMDDVITNQIEMGDPSDTTYPKIGKPQLGTVSLSGNDLRFGDIVNACLYHWVGYGDCSALLKEAHQALDDPGRVFELKVFDALVKILIRARTANSSFQLYVTGYIRFWNDQNTQCDTVSWAPSYKAAAPLTTTLRQDMNALVLKLNKLLGHVAEGLREREGGVYFVDEFESKFDGHRFCEHEDDVNYHTSPIGERTWFIHYDSPYANPATATGLGSGSFFDQVDGVLIPPKDGKSTAEQINEVDGDLVRLHPAYENVDTMTNALMELGRQDANLAMLPVTWIRIMHPKGSGYTEMSNAVIDKVLEFSATGGEEPAPAPVDAPEQGLQCFGVETSTFIGRDDMNDKIGRFCAEAAAQRVQDKDSGSTMRRFSEGTRFEVDISMDWPSGLDISSNMEQNCKDKMTVIMDACDGNNPENPMNWKHGGTLGDGPIRYGIYPKIDQGYRPGSCSFHLQENVAWSGVDGPGTHRTWRFSVEQLKMFDHNKNEIGRAGYKHNSGDGEAIKCGDGNPFKWETKLPNVLEITPEAVDHYIQFTIGSRSWRTSDGQCSVGDYDGHYSPIDRNMDCSFPC